MYVNNRCNYKQLNKVVQCDNCYLLGYCNIGGVYTEWKIVNLKTKYKMHGTHKIINNFVLLIRICLLHVHYYTT